MSLTNSLYSGLNLHKMSDIGQHSVVTADVHATDHDVVVTDVTDDVTMRDAKSMKRSRSLLFDTADCDDENVMKKPRGKPRGKVRGRKVKNVGNKTKTSRITDDDKVNDVEVVEDIGIQTDECSSVTSLCDASTQCNIGAELLVYSNRVLSDSIMSCIGALITPL